MITAHKRAFAIGTYKKTYATGITDWSGSSSRYTVSEPAASISVWIDTSPTSSSDTEALLRARFQELASQWKRDTAHQSMLTSKVGHPAYQGIMRMGDSAIPLILEELERAPDHWFWALHFLTGQQPLPDDFGGTITDAANLWVVWGRQQGLLTDATKRAVWALPETQAIPIHDYEQAGPQLQLRRLGSG